MGLIRNTRILLKLSPYMDKLGEQITMTKNVHGVTQIILTMIQATNGIQGFFPETSKQRFGIIVGISALQGILAVLNHFDTDTNVKETAAVQVTPDSTTTIKTKETTTIAVETKDTK